MITTPGLSINFIKKEPYAGSYRGMRFTFASTGEAIDAILYPEPWCLEATPKEDRIQKQFPLSEDGLSDAVAWADAMYEENPDKWAIN